MSPELEKKGDCFTPAIVYTLAGLCLIVVTLALGVPLTAQAQSSSGQTNSAGTNWQEIERISSHQRDLASQKAAENSALEFDGTDDYVAIPGDSTINRGPSPRRTIEAWFRVDDKTISSRRQVIWEEGGGKNGFNIYVYDGALYAGAWSESKGWGGTWLRTTDIESDRWHHAALVFNSDNGVLEGYIDGNKFGSSTPPAEVAHHPDEIAIGAIRDGGKFKDGGDVGSGGNHFEGRIDEVRIWNVRRSATEVQQNIGNELTGSESGLAAYWPLNDGTGSTATDETENDNDGMVSGASWVSSDAFNGAADAVSVTIDGRRITSQTLPSGENTPEDAVPYPPNKKFFFRDGIEVLRYPADHAVVRARVSLSDAFDGSVEDISVEATLDGETMKTVIRDSVDANHDGKIDSLPFDHYRTGPDTRYADILLVSSQSVQNGAKDLNLEVTSTTASGEKGRATEKVSFYYAKHGEEARPFDPQTDGYRFSNLADLNLKEITTQLLSYGVSGGAAVLYRQEKSYDGRCFGMAGTAGVYFDEPGKKVFSGETYEQPASDTDTRQQITDYHIAQNWRFVDLSLENPDLSSEYDKARSILKDGSTPMIGIDYADLGDHAVLATKLTVLQDRAEAVFELHDSNYPGTTYDLSYDISSETLNPSYMQSTVDDIEAFAALDVDDVPFFPEGDWYRSIIADLVDGAGEVFTATFASSEETNKSSSTTAKETSEWITTRVLVENEQGNRAGHLPDGTKVNEIDGAVVDQVVTDSAAGEKASYVAVPPGETYDASISVSDDGDINFEHALPTDSTKAEVNRAEGMSFTSSSSGTYDEESGEIALDKDGDGTVDKTISTESSVLPVELAELTARLEGASTAVVSWKTASETNNAGFEVQRKTGDESAEAWSKVGFVESEASDGTTDEPLTYQFEDGDLPFAADRLEYRLRQINLDGSAELLGPVAVERRTDHLELEGPFPNPASDQAVVQLAVPEGREVTLHLYDTLGRQVRTLIEGESQGRQTVQVDLSGLSNGTYFLQLQTSVQTKTKRLTVVQ